MAYPGIYNITYYKGDTLEFRIYPKNSDGTIFDLSSYKDLGQVIFTISTERGVPGDIAYAEISSDGTSILCAIEPSLGNTLNVTGGSILPYVYDVEISKPGAEYEYVYTLLTGTITVNEQVTGAGES